MFNSKDENDSLKHVAKFQHEDKKKLQLVILFQLGLITALLFLIVTDWNTKPQPVYFQENSTGQLIDPVPVNKPTLNNAAIINWFAQAMMATYSFNYKNQDLRFIKLKQYYTQNGYNKFIATFKKNKNLSNIDRDKLVVSMKILEAPEFLQDGVVGGIYSWNIRMPILVRLQNQVFNKTVALNLEAIVIRVPETVSPIGVLIDDFVAINTFNQ